MNIVAYSYPRGNSVFFMTNDSGSHRIAGNFFGKDILSLDQFSPRDISILFTLVEKIIPTIKKKGFLPSLKGKLVTMLFYEPSSRTFGSFSAAVKRLSGQTLDIVNPEVSSSVSKGETLEDTIKVFETYSDAIVIRHREVGTALRAAQAAHVPILNAGDGVGEHPTQALLDLYTIYEKHKRLDSLTGLLVGDLLNGRTIHSLIRGLSIYKKNRLYLLSPKQLRLSKADFFEFKKRNIELIEISSEKEIPPSCDFWYWTRVQKERFLSLQEYEKVKNAFILTPDLIAKYAGKKTIFMHPLPRVGEILTTVDEDPRALYLRNQIQNGMYIRMALLTLILTK